MILNDPCTVARRHQGWMVLINARIHPTWRGEGGKERDRQRERETEDAGLQRGKEERVCGVV